MNINPYAPPTAAATPSKRFVALVSVFGAFWSTFLGASWAALGASGIAPAVGLIAVSWFVLSRSASPRLYPVNRKPMPITDLLTIGVICLVLYGLMLPAVSSMPRRNSRVTVPVSIQSNGTLNAGASINESP